MLNQWSEINVLHGDFESEIKKIKILVTCTCETYLESNCAYYKHTFCPFYRFLTVSSFSVVAITHKLTDSFLFSDVIIPNKNPEKCGAKKDH